MLVDPLDPSRLCRIGSKWVYLRVDAGITVDIDGEPRRAGVGYGLGADELWYKVYLPLVLRDG
jgi:hypothetical protein